jgi:nuclear pore complex protein Nup160
MSLADQIATEFLLSPTSIVLKLAQCNRFNTAMATARSLNIDMTDLFAHLTGQCLRISRNPDSIMQVVTLLF